jgi:hypothetical protein
MNMGFSADLVDMVIRDGEGIGAGVDPSLEDLVMKLSGLQADYDQVIHLSLLILYSVLLFL